MDIRFDNDYLEALASDQPIKGKPRYNKEVVLQFEKKLKILQFLPDGSIALFKSLHFEYLKGNLSGLCSIGIDYHYRLIFKIEKGEESIQEIIVITDLNNHYQ